MKTNQTLTKEFDNLMEQPIDNVLVVSRCIGASYDRFKMMVIERYPNSEEYTIEQLNSVAGDYKYNMADTGIIEVLINSMGRIFMNPKAKKTQRTYIMIDKNTGYYKIGKSMNPKFREKTIQSEKPTVELLVIFENDIEKLLHEKYKAKRVRGEWFSLAKSDLIDIRKNYKLNINTK